MIRTLSASRRALDRAFGVTAVQLDRRNLPERCRTIRPIFDGFFTQPQSFIVLALLETDITHDDVSETVIFPVLHRLRRPLAGLPQRFGWCVAPPSGDVNPIR